jgi:putative RecB family exonuclease
MTTYSHSRLGTFEDCPLRYKFTYIERPEVETVETADAFMGSRVHEVLQRLYKDLKHEKRNSLQDLLAYHDELWEKKWSDQIRIIKEGLTEENYKKVGERCIRDYYNRYQPFDQGRTIATERQVWIEIEGHKLQGYIDRLTKLSDGYYEIHDYKASQRLPPQKDLDTDRQLALYQLGVQQRWRDVERVDLVWHYLAFDMERRSDRTEEQLDELERSVVSLIRQIERAEEVGDFPPNREHCDWCEFQSICPEWGHELKVEPLSANEFLEEPGVKLVNRFAELKSKQRELERQEGKLREAIIAYAKREDVSCIRGSKKKIYVRIRPGIKFPGSGEKSREELEELIKGAGRWEEVSSLSVQRLEKIAREQSWPPELLEHLKRYQRLEESASVRMYDLKEGED